MNKEIILRLLDTADRMAVVNGYRLVKCIYPIYLIDAHKIDMAGYSVNYRYNSYDKCWDVVICHPQPYLSTRYYRILRETD